MNVDLASQPQFDYKQLVYSPPAVGSIPPAFHRLNLTPQFYHRRVYMHCAELWKVRLVFSMNGQNQFDFIWTSRTFPAVPRQDEMRFSFLNDVIAGPNEMIYSQPSDATVFMKPFVLIGQWNEVILYSSERDPTAQGWYFGIRSQSHW